MGDESTKTVKFDQWGDHQGHAIRRSKVVKGIFIGFCEHCKREVKMRYSVDEENTINSNES